MYICLNNTRNVLEELSKRDSEWRRIALKECSDKSLADDIVQEFYLKAMRYEKINTSYAYQMIKCIFKDWKKKKKDVRLLETEYIEDQQTVFEPDDEEKKILDKIDSLPWLQQELLAENYNRSYRQIQEVYNINYAFTHRQITEAKKIVLNGIKTNYPKEIKGGILTKN